MKRQNPQKAVDQWNARVSVGDQVEYRPVAGRDDGMRVTTTTTPAEVLGGHTAVVWLEGVRGCVAIQNCTSRGG